MTDRVEVDFDHHGPEFAADPVGTLRDLRTRCPIVRSTHYEGFWLPLTYELVAEASRDPQTFSSARNPPDSPVMAVSIPAVWETDVWAPIELDPPVHTAYRRMLNPLFSRTAIEQNLAPLLRALTEYFVDRVIERGECDFVLDVAAPVPAVLTLMYLGMPTDDWQRISQTQHNLVACHPDTPEYAAAIAGQAFQAELLTETIARKRVEPGPDVITYLTRQSLDGQPLTDRQIHQIVTLIIGGGVDTATALLGQAFQYLEDRPSDRAALLADPGLLDTATDEFLRFFSPSSGHARTVTRPVELGGQKLDIGDRVLLSWPAANRDPAAFEDPDTIRLDRSPNNHAAFGLSVHRCIGANLGRLEFQVVLTEVLRRIPEYRIDRTVAHRYPSYGLTTGWSIMPITFAPGTPTGDGRLPAYRPVSEPGARA
jgi:cytochrome P450